jgi:hypothetical protein
MISFRFLSESWQGLSGHGSKEESSAMESLLLEVFQQESSRPIQEDPYDSGTAVAKVHVVHTTCAP